MSLSWTKFLVQVWFRSAAKMRFLWRKSFRVTTMHNRWNTTVMYWISLVSSWYTSLAQVTPVCIAGVLKRCSLQPCKGQSMMFTRRLLIIHLAAKTFLELVMWKLLASEYANQLTRLKKSSSKASLHSLKGMSLQALKFWQFCASQSHMASHLYLS